MLLGIYTSWGANCVSMGQIEDGTRLYEEALHIAQEVAPGNQEVADQIGTLESILEELDAFKREIGDGRAYVPAMAE